MWGKSVIVIFVLSVAVKESFAKTLIGKAHKNILQHEDESRDDEIVGGDLVNITQYPYQIGLIYKQRIQFCGGSIISEDYILTAAHCVQNNLVDSKAVTVRVGSSYANSGGKLYGVSKVIVHPKYTSSDYDMAILKLSEKIPLNTETSKAVKLPDVGSHLKPGDKLIVTGWGHTSFGGDPSEQLRAVTVPVIGNDKCKEVYSDLTDRMVCAGYDEGGKDACQGDSGGPAITENNLVQYGIVSFGIGCAYPHYPGVYTNIPALRDWIKEITGI